jgi:hypothetical protein
MFFTMFTRFRHWSVSSWRWIHFTPKKNTKLRGLSLQANYTDRATSACRRSYCQLLRVEGVAWSAQRIPTAVNVGFLDRSRYFFSQVAPQLSSRGWVDPIPDHPLLRKSGRAGNRTRDLWICSEKFWPLDHRGHSDDAVELRRGLCVRSLLLWPYCDFIYLLLIILTL